MLLTNSFFKIVFSCSTLSNFSLYFSHCILNWCSVLICCLIASSSFCNKVSYSWAAFWLSLVCFFNSSSTFIATIISIEVLTYSIKFLIGLLINWFDSSIFFSSEKFSIYKEKYLYK